MDGITSFLEYRKSKWFMHFRAYVGYLEAMYGGAGLEALYSPMQSRWGIGLTLNALRQRSFAKNLDFLPYTTVTGYMSFFYAAPVYNYDAAFSSRRYLGRDKGGTLELRRTFWTTAFRIGAFFPEQMFQLKNMERVVLIRVFFSRRLRACFRSIPMENIEQSFGR